MPTTLDPPKVDVDLSAIPVLDGDDICHVLRGDTDTQCGAPYDCLPAGRCSVYNGQECCPDCGRPICPKCADRMFRRGEFGGIRRKG